MNALAWILSIVLAVVFLGSGLSKVATPYEKLRTNPNLGYVNDFSSRQIKAIGAVEVLGAVGVILPWVVNVARVLTPIAALGLAVTMAAAFAVHVRRGEMKRALPINTGLLVLAVVVAVLRFTQL